MRCSSVLVHTDDWLSSAVESLSGIPKHCVRFAIPFRRAVFIRRPPGIRRPLNSSVVDADARFYPVLSAIRKFIFVPERCSRSGLLRAEAGQGLPPFHAPLSPLEAPILRFAPDSFLLTKPNTSCTIELPASLRSDGVRDHPGMPFGFPPEQAFSFAGMPTILRVPRSMTTMLLPSVPGLPTPESP